MKPSFLTRRILTALAFGNASRNMMLTSCLLARWHRKSRRPDLARAEQAQAAKSARLFASEYCELQACFEIIVDRQFIMNLEGVA